MASWAKPEVRTATDPKGPTLVQPIEIEFQSIRPTLKLASGLALDFRSLGGVRRLTARRWAWALGASGARVLRTSAALFWNPPPFTLISAPAETRGSGPHQQQRRRGAGRSGSLGVTASLTPYYCQPCRGVRRSEERRVGKECR